MRWQTVERSLRSSLVLALLVLACVALLQVNFLLAQLAVSAGEIERASVRALADAERTLAIVRQTTERQRGSYENIARHTERSLANLSVLIERTDTRMERLMPAVESTLQEAGRAAQTLSSESEQTGAEVRQLLQTSTEAVTSLNRVASDPAFDESARSLSESSRNLERFSLAAAESAESVRDMLSPKKKSFWRRVLELLIPRPTVRVWR